MVVIILHYNPKQIPEVETLLSKSEKITLHKTEQKDTSTSLYLSGTELAIQNFLTHLRVCSSLHGGAEFHISENDGSIPEGFLPKEKYKIMVCLVEADSDSEKAIRDAHETIDWFSSDPLPYSIAKETYNKIDKQTELPDGYSVSEE